MLLARTSGAPAPIDDATVEALRATLHGGLLSRGDAGYDEARVVFNGIFDRHPALIARCRGTADVMDAVRFAREHELLTAVRGGGHSVAGKSTCDDGFVIDLSLMRGVHVERQARTIRVGGGAVWADVDREAQAFGLATPGGVVSHTGVAGLTLNGGIGWLRNKHGLSCDNLLSAELITAEGELVTASESENADLLWALRGGGGNFGVVTSFQFRLHPVGPMVAAAFPMYAMAQSRERLTQWRDWVLGSPDEVSSEFVLWTMPNASHVPPPARGLAVVIPGAVYAGAPEKGEKVLQPLRTLGEPVAEIAGSLPFRGVQTAFDLSYPNTGELLNYWKSAYVNTLSDELIELVADLAAHRSTPSTMIVVQHFGGAVKDVPADATAFATRDHTFIVSFMGTWRDPRESEEHIAWVRDAWDRVAPHSTGAVYLNYLGREDRDAETLVRSAFGANYPRLAAIKSKYDPANLFRLNQNIAPSS